MYIIVRVSHNPKEHGKEVYYYDGVFHTLWGAKRAVNKCFNLSVSDDASICIERIHYYNTQKLINSMIDRVEERADKLFVRHTYKAKHAYSHATHKHDKANAFVAKHRTRTRANIDHVDNSADVIVETDK